MSEENEGSLPAVFVCLVVIVAVLIGGGYWVLTKRSEQVILAREAELQARDAELQAATRLVADATFEFQLGQGSGWHGLNTIKIAADGNAEYEYKSTSSKWERKKFFVDKQRIESLIDSINTLKIRSMENEYIDRDIQDGSQWVLLVKGGGHAKSIYCSNLFPEQIKQLADHVHKTIIDPLGKNVEARAVSEEDHSKLEKELWDSIK